MPKNEQVEDVAVNIPKFLKMDNVRVKSLVGVANEVTKFNRIKKDEWLPKKKDKRFSSKRKRYEDYNP
jgi:hypothetical protein